MKYYIVDDDLGYLTRSSIPFNRNVTAYCKNIKTNVIYDINNIPIMDLDDDNIMISNDRMLLSDLKIMTLEQVREDLESETNNISNLYYTKDDKIPIKESKEKGLEFTHYICSICTIERELQGLDVKDRELKLSIWRDIKRYVNCNREIKIDLAIKILKYYGLTLNDILNKTLL